MPPKKLPSKAAQKHEMEAFAEKYDLLGLVYGDPVDVLFQIMARSFNPGADEKGNAIVPNDELAVRTADMLMSYRYPRVKATELVKPQGSLMQFNVVMQSAPAQAPAVEITTPKRPALTIKAGE